MRSELSHKRRVAQNLTHDGRRIKAPKQAHNPKSVTPGQRVKEFPNECFTVSGIKLLCTACQQEVALKSVASCWISKHACGKRRLDSKERRERDIVSSLVVYEAETHSRGETLPDAHRIYHAKVAMTFLRAGVPLNKIECFRPLLEEHAFSFDGRRTISDLIPFILQNERTVLKQEIEG